MRRRLRLLVLAVTALVVVAFVLPLAVLVVRQADQRARADAERDVQTVAANLVSVLVSSRAEIDATWVSAALGPLPDGVGVVLPGDGGVIGDPADVVVVGRAETERAAVSTYARGDWQLAFPVILREGTAVVTAVVPRAELRAGVVPAISLLVSLGVVLVFAGLLLADRLGRTLVEPMSDLADAARRLGDGDLDTRVHVEDPAEAAQVGEAFNRLASRLGAIIAAERESVADLSHRLRTPLTVLRLQSEQVADDELRESLLSGVDRLERGIDEVIAEARRPVEVPTSSELAEIVGDRAAFWRVLADEQGRAMRVSIPEERVPVPISAHDLGTAVDAVIGNVFDHTPPGTAFSLEVLADPVPTFVIRDEGPGFPPGLDPVARGASGAGSTGLGLDIARRAAERAGGGLDATNAPEGGALVVMRLGA